MQSLAHQRGHWRRSAPEVVIARLRDWRLFVHPPDTAARLVAKTVCRLDRANFARTDEIDGVAHSLGASALGAGLADLAEFAGEFDDHAPFLDVVADRLLDVHVLAGLHGQDR